MSEKKALIVVVNAVLSCFAFLCFLLFIACLFDYCTLSSMVVFNCILVTKLKFAYCRFVYSSTISPEFAFKSLQEQRVISVSHP